MAGVQSIERAFLVLRALALRSYGITELADRTGLPKSTVARLLNALEAEDAVVQADPGGHYRIGPGIAAIAVGANQGRSLIETARPFLIDLSEQMGESTGIDVFKDGWVEFNDEVAVEQDVQIRDWTGEWGRAHSLPTGIVMLAHSTRQVVDDYIDEGLETSTPKTITDPEALRERLAQVRSAGYAWGFEEFVEGINSVAAPVFDAEGVVAALRVHGPTYRFPDPNRAHDIGLAVAEAAARLSELLQA